MADVDARTIERISRWCAEAGRQAGPDDVRRALAPLTWDEVLALEALLASPPPARPLGPMALADMARGAPPDLAAEREKEGRYRPDREDEPAAPPHDTARQSSATARARRGQRKGGRVVIHRARDRVPAPPPRAESPPLLEELRRPEGRGVLERLLRRHGGRRAALMADLAAGWRRTDGASLGDPDLDALLDHHGLARSFARRERDEVLHALRAEGGVRAAAAARVGLDAVGLDRTIARLGAAAEAEAIREERRAELRGRATLAERVRLVTDSGERLADLGLLEEFEADLLARLPELVRALRVAGQPLAPALARSLSIPLPDARALSARFGLDLGESWKQKRLGRRLPRPAPMTERRRPPRAGESRPRSAAPGGASRRTSAPASTRRGRRGSRRS